jgi:hypothetical protein
MDHGARITLEDGMVTGGANLQRLAIDGAIDRDWPVRTVREPDARREQGWP